MTRVLAMSSSRVGGGSYLQTGVPMIEEFLGRRPLRIAFIPFASVDRNYTGYHQNVATALASLSHEIVLVEEANALTTIENSDVVMVGGGNTFKLLHDLYSLELVSAIATLVNEGMPYIGWSAGANLAGPTICTTNDMPIVQPQAFCAFGFLPFQINPHYINQNVEGFHGETRDQRLEEYVTLNTGMQVLALPEGTALRLEEEELIFLGEKPPVLFERKESFTRKELGPERNLSVFLKQNGELVR